LAIFETFYPVLALPGAMGRVAHELVVDAAADGVVHLEARCCPALQADAAGRDDEAVLREVLDGLLSGARETGCSVGAIVCCYRSLPPERNAALVELALRHAGRGVVGVDLAGPEHLPGAPHAAAFARARDAGLPVTLATDDPAVCDTTLSREHGLAARTWGYGPDTLAALTRTAIDAAFVDDARRRALHLLLAEVRG
jgi:adenosine deaminase